MVFIVQKTELIYLHMYVSSTPFLLRNEIDDTAFPDRSRFQDKFGQHLDLFCCCFFGPTLVGQALGLQEGTRFHPEREYQKNRDSDAFQYREEYPQIRGSDAFL